MNVLYSESESVVGMHESRESRHHVHRTCAGVVTAVRRVPLWTQGMLVAATILTTVNLAANRMRSLSAHRTYHCQDDGRFGTVSTSFRAPGGPTPILAIQYAP